MSPFELVVVWPLAFKGLTESIGRELARNALFIQRNLADHIDL
jgi:hypothetical protein